MHTGVSGQANSPAVSFRLPTMVRYDKETQIFAASIAALAGYVDATGFVATGGYFISFMSGNSTRLGVDASAHLQRMTVPLSFIAMFVAGVVLASLVKRKTPAPWQSAAVVAGAATVLSACAFLMPFLNPYPICLLSALGMGWINLLFEEEGDVRIGLTYVTGTLVKLGHHIANALVGGRALAWLPFLGLWFGLAGGAAAGAIVTSSLGLRSLWFAVPYAWGLVAFAILLEGRSRKPDAG